jgi:hypothetical protein
MLTMGRTVNIPANDQGITDRENSFGKRATAWSAMSNGASPYSKNGTNEDI